MFMLINGFRMFYDDIGQGFPVVLLHGYPLSHEIWAPQIEAITSKFRLITPDFRGHGDSGTTSGSYRMDLLAGDVAHLVRELGINPPIVLGGLSMGGYVAMAFARRYPELLAGLFLTATRADADSETGKEGRLKAVEAARQARSSLPAIEGMLPKLFAPRTYEENPNLVQEVRKIMEKVSMAGVINTQLGMSERPDSYETLRNLQIPGLMIYGKQDQIIPEDASVQTGAAFKDSTVKAIQDGGHLLNMEQPGEFNQILVEWLEQFQEDVR